MSEGMVHSWNYVEISQAEKNKHQADRTHLGL